MNASFSWLTWQNCCAHISESRRNFYVHEYYGVFRQGLAVYTLLSSDTDPPVSGIRLKEPPTCSQRTRACFASHVPYRKMGGWCRRIISNSRAIWAKWWVPGQPWLHQFEASMSDMMHCLKRANQGRQDESSVEPLDAKPDDLTSVPGTHKVGRRKLPLRSCPLTSVGVVPHICTQTYIHV